MPNCSARAVTLPENGFCDMTEALSAPSRRIMAIWLMRLAIDRWRQNRQAPEGEGKDAQPLALIAETAHGLRIAAANAAGLGQAGARPGMMLADARALCPSLATAPSDPAADLALLEKLALWAQRWGPWSAVHPPDGVLVDITGAARLFGGEARLLADARALLAGRGFAARLAIAPTAGAAWALSHYGTEGAIFHPGDSLDALPVAALRLDDDVPAAAAPSRAQADRRSRRDRARCACPPLPHTSRAGSQSAGAAGPAARPCARATAAGDRARRTPGPAPPDGADPPPCSARPGVWPISPGTWRGCWKGACWGRGGSNCACGGLMARCIRRHLELASSSRDPEHISGLLEARLGHIEAGFGIELVRLRAPWTERLALSQADLEAAAETHGTSLSACIDRLTVRLGEGAVHRPVPHASHVPERAQRWESLSGAPSTSVDGLRPILPPIPTPAPPPGHPEYTISLGGRPHRRKCPPDISVPLGRERAGAASSREAGQERPLKLLDRAEPIAVIHASPEGLPRRFRWRGQVHEVARAEGPERIAPEWWRERSGARLRDYYRIEDEEGRRYWIYRAGLAGDGRGPRPDAPPEWFLHGLCG